VEVADSKSSVDLSDEERLVAGVSTTRLQTKKLSGAQRKGITRERTMKEVTWPDKKPPSKTASSQEIGAVGSSGGVNRPHSDSTTPSSEKQQPKNPRNTQVQTGSYTEGVADINMVVIHRRHSDVKMHQEQADLILVKRLTAVDANASGEAPRHFLCTLNLHTEYSALPMQTNLLRSS
jgi:hypothetical protein